jgi:integrase/recombinase XerC
MRILVIDCHDSIVDDLVRYLGQLGVVSPADPLPADPNRHPVPTFAEYVPVVSAGVSAGTRRVYGSYWNRVLEQWATRRLDEPTPSDMRQLAEQVRRQAMARHNARGGRSAAEHLIAALRCLYNRAVADGYVAEADNPARQVAKPRRPGTRAGVGDDYLR